MKNYILPSILIILGGLGFYFGNKNKGAGINPAAAIYMYGGILLIISGIIISIFRYNKNN